MANWRPDPSLLARPIYRSLAEQFTNAIRAGRLGQGEMLPPHRTLAYDLGISIQSVGKAYDVLARKGLVTGEVGRGTFVRLSPGGTSQTPYLAQRSPDLIDMSIVSPVCASLHVERTRQALHRLSRTIPPASMLSFRPSTIFPRHHEAAGRWLSGLGVETLPQNILVTNGVSTAFTTVLMTVAPAGSRLAAEDVCYHVVRPLCEHLGIEAQAIEADDEGMMPEALDDVCGRERIAAIALQPNIANPTATVMSDKRRRRIAEVARKHDLTIIETDIFGPLMEDRKPPIAAFAPERTIYITGFTKIAAPALRIAYVASPDAFAALIANRYLTAHWMATPILTEIATAWLLDGTMDELVGWQRDALARRHKIVNEALGSAHRRAHPAAPHLWLPLPPGYDEGAFVSQARARGVAVAPSLPFSLVGRELGAVRVSLGAEDESRLRSGLETIALLLNAKPDRTMLMV